MKPVAGFNANPQNINKKGRPKEAWTMSGILKEALEEQDETGTPYKLTINRKLRALALQGDIVAIKEVNNRIDGQSQQKTDITTDGQPIKLNIIAGGGYIPEPVEIDASPEKGTV